MSCGILCATSDIHGPSVELGKLFLKHTNVLECPGQKVSYAESMIDISGREFGSLVGMPAWD